MEWDRGFPSDGHIIDGVVYHGTSLIRSCSPLARRQVVPEMVGVDTKVRYTKDPESIGLIKPAKLPGHQGEAPAETGMTHHEVSRRKERSQVIFYTSVSL